MKEITVYVEDEEFDSINAKAAESGQTLGDYLRAVLFGKDRKGKDGAEKRKTSARKCKQIDGGVRS